jgi:hypothetical protein
LLRACRDRLGESGWRLVLDILRFTPTTASIIASRYPQAAALFAEELGSTAGDSSLRELARTAKKSKEHVKKIRPGPDRQAEIYCWFREQLDKLGCGSIILAPCKGDPAELHPLVHQKIIRAMPCACYGVTNK